MYTGMRESSGSHNATTAFPKIYSLHCSAIFPFLLWSVLVSSCSGYVNWIYPSGDDSGLTFNYVDTVYFTWTSNITEPYMSLWCVPSPTSALYPTDGPHRLFNEVYHSEVSTNGTNPQSFPYSNYSNHGICFMQMQVVEDSAPNDTSVTGAFTITSNDAVSPRTWGVSALSKLGDTSNQTAVQTLLSSTEVSLIASSTPFSTPPASTPLSPPSSVGSSPLSSSLTIVSSTTSSAVKPTTSKMTTRAAATKSAATTARAAATTPATTTSPPSHTLTGPAKVGISVLSALFALTLLILILSYHKTWSKRTKSRAKSSMQHLSIPAPSQIHEYPNIPEIGEGAYTEINGISRPAELCGTPRAELA